jgi:hypothetical protein
MRKPATADLRCSRFALAPQGDALHAVERRISSFALLSFTIILGTLNEFYLQQAAARQFRTSAVET